MEGMGERGEQRSGDRGERGDQNRGNDRGGEEYDDSVSHRSISTSHTFWTQVIMTFSIPLTHPLHLPLINLHALLSHIQLVTLF